MKEKKKRQRGPLLYREIFRSQLILIILMTFLSTAIGISLTFYYENRHLDQNLQNVAGTIASFVPVRDSLKNATQSAALQEDDTQSEVLNSNSEIALAEYLDPLMENLSDVDVVSVIGTDGIRHYHSNPEYINSAYDGTMPEFVRGEKEFYTSSDVGPSGRQRRAYAAIYDEDGVYRGFVLAVMLRQNILKTMITMAAVYMAAALILICAAVYLSSWLSKRIRKRLMGYEPETFRAMFQIRDSILETLDEGVVAIDKDERIVFLNQAAAQMLRMKKLNPIGKKMSDIYSDPGLSSVLQTGTTEGNVQINTIENADILSDRLPLRENGEIVGAVGIYRNRTEYTKLMEDLSGVRYMVDSMRASNHDFTNKLHVILGLIQMEMYEEAIQYIMNVTLVERETIHSIMQAIDEPAVAALLIGKHARASELNIRFSLKSGSEFKRGIVEIPSGSLVTLIGNLLDNAMESMNEKDDPTKELTLGIFTRLHEIVITVDDTGKGMTQETQEHLFEYGYSTKGEGRGTGMYLVKQLVDSCGGTILLESEPGEGSSFTVVLKDTDKN